MKLEDWKPIFGFEGLYEVSGSGHIRSTYRGGKVLKGNVDGRGYNRLWLWKGHLKYKHSLHRLVAKAFLPNKNGHLCVNHINGNKLDNRVSNLEWCSYQENTRHAFANGLMKGSSAPRPYRKKPVLKEWKDGGISYPGASDAAYRTGISITAIANCLSGRSKTAGGFKWRYL